MSGDNRILDAEAFTSHLRAMVLAALTGDRRGEAEDSKAIHAHDEALRAALATAEAERDRLARDAHEIERQRIVIGELTQSVEQLAEERDGNAQERNIYRVRFNARGSIIAEAEARVAALTEALRELVEASGQDELVRAINRARALLVGEPDA